MLMFKNNFTTFATPESLKHFHVEFIHSADGSVATSGNAGVVDRLKTTTRCVGGVSRISLA